jgi:hypothetical protein
LTLRISIELLKNRDRDYSLSIYKEVQQMSVELIIGAPVKDRAWILPHYLDAAQEAAERSGMSYKFVFALDKRDRRVGNDQETILGNWGPHQRAPEFRFVYTQNVRSQYKRDWNFERYVEMSRHRNVLLQAVREEQPDFFLSLDTDMIVHPELINSFMRDIDKFDAIGGRAYMTTSRTNFPSIGIFDRHGRMRRPDGELVRKADVIMAIKFMTPRAYSIDYEPHSLGEDIGWSNKAREEGLILGWDGRLVNRHIMAPDLLTKDDKRVPWCKWDGAGFNTGKVVDDIQINWQSGS